MHIVEAVEASVLRLLRRGSFFRSSLKSSSSVLNRQKKPLDGKSRKEGRGRVEWLLDFMFQLYVDGRMYEYVPFSFFFSLHSLQERG